MQPAAQRILSLHVNILSFYGLKMRTHNKIHFSLELKMLFIWLKIVRFQIRIATLAVDINLLKCVYSALFLAQAALWTFFFFFFFTP